MRDSNGRLSRWSLYLQPFDFSINHRPGRQNGNVDGFSRENSAPNICRLGNVSLLSKLGRFVYLPQLQDTPSRQQRIVSPLVVIFVMQMPLDAPLLDRPLVLTLIRFPGLMHRFVIRMVWRNLGSSVSVQLSVVSSALQMLCFAPLSIQLCLKPRPSSGQIEVLR